MWSERWIDGLKAAPDWDVFEMWKMWWLNCSDQLCLIKTGVANIGDKKYVLYNA